MPRAIATSPTVYADLRRVLAGVDGLWDRADDAAHASVALGSLAALDDELPEARFATIHAVQALTNALDHLKAWERLVAGRFLPVQAHMTLLRGALEGAVRCRWLVDPKVDSATRVARGWAAQRDDYDERRKWEETGEWKPDERARLRPRPPGKTATERIAELDALRAEAGVASGGFTDATALMIHYKVERFYRLTSAAAHGKEWALVAAELDPVAPAQPRAGMGQGRVSASNEISLALTRVAVSAVERALADFEGYIRASSASR